MAVANRYSWCIFVAVFLFLSIATITVHAHSKASDDDIITNYEFTNKLHMEILRPFQGHHFQRTNQSRMAFVEPLYLRHNDSFRLALSAYNTTFYLHLEPHLDLVHPDAEISVWENGKKKLIRNFKPRVYKGIVLTEEYSTQKLSWDRAGVVGFIQKDGTYFPNPDPATWSIGDARIYVHDSGSATGNPNIFADPVMQGVFTYKDETYNIKPIHVYQRSKRSEDATILHPDQRPSHARNSKMIIYRESDRQGMLTKRSNIPGAPESNCGTNKLSGNQNYFDSLGESSGLMSAARLRKRDTSSTACVANKKFVYMGVAADCTYFELHKTSEEVIAQLVANWNKVDSIYESTFNVGVGIFKIEIKSTCDNNPAWNQKCSDQYDINSRLSDFSQWRGNLGEDGTGLWHLMTTCSYVYMLTLEIFLLKKKTS